MAANDTVETEADGGENGARARKPAEGEAPGVDPVCDARDVTDRADIRRESADGKHS